MSSNRLAILLLAPLLAAGCTRTDALPREQAPTAMTNRPTVLAGGDLIEVKLHYAPELNDTQQIRPDGFISLQLVGEVEAAGKSPAVLSAELIERYAKHLQQPEVVVILRQALERRVFVAGAVAAPGAVAMPADLTALQAISLAGGHDPRAAAMTHVVVMRNTDAGQRVGYRVDLRDALRGRATEPFALAPGDHVYVPRTGIVEANQFIEQYVGGVIPDGLRVTRALGNTTYGVDTAVLD
jgi:protein involved in polysaccharide export with SLBB domain